MAVIITTHYIEEAKQANYVSSRAKIEGEVIKERYWMKIIIKKRIKIRREN